MIQRLKRTIALTLSICFIFTQSGFAQVASQLNLAGRFSQARPAAAFEAFRPLHLRYFSYDIKTDQFKVLLDKGDQQKLAEPQIKGISKELLAYFLVGVSLPDDCFWVNLRPDSENQIIDERLALTDVGKVLLEADLQLKKDTALYTSPKTPTGKKYWELLYKKAAELYGTDNVSIPTLTRPWIVPNEIIIRQTANSAYIYKSTLKVMLEQDHLKGSQAYSFKDERAKKLNDYSSELIRKLIIPELNKEVNSSKKYASLRQVYYSLVLSRWFKANFTGKAGTYSSLINSGRLEGLTSKESWSKSTYFNAYKQSFEKGEYNIQAPVMGISGQSIRTYFSGGADFKGAAMSSPLGTFQAPYDDIPGGANGDFMLILGNGKMLAVPDLTIMPTHDDTEYVVAKPATPAKLSSPIRVKKVSSPMGGKVLSPEEVSKIFELQKAGRWEEVQKAQADLQATLVATYESNWQAYKEKHPHVVPLFDIGDPSEQSHTITSSEADEYNLSGHLKEFDKKSEASTAGIRAFIDLLHSENPSKMYNDMFVALLIEAEAEFLRDVHKELSKRLPRTESGVKEFAAQLRKDIDQESLKIIEEIYGMPLEAIIPFLRDNVVKLVGGEVRVHTAKFSEMEARILAAKGIKVITPENYSDSVPIYMYSFLTFILGASGATHYTSSHSANYLFGRKVLAPDGAQLLPDVYESYRRILRRIIDEDIYKKGGYTVRVSSRNDPGIISRLSYSRMSKLYRSILNITAAEVDLINEATRKGQRIVLNGLNGSTWKTLKPILETVGIDIKAFKPVMVEENKFFNAGYIVTQGKDGSYSIDHLGIDTTLSKVVQTIPYSALLKNEPVGTMVMECDPDSDRFVVKQIVANSADNQRLIKEYALASYKLDESRVLVAPSPNKAFLVLDIVDHEIMREAGTWDEFWSLYFITYVSTRAWVEFAESVPGLIRVMAQVGFKNLTALQRQVEDWYFNRPNEFTFTFKDQLGRDITISRDRKIRTHSKEEESGGRVAGMNRPSVNVLGQKVIAMPEKSAADSLLSQLTFASKLYLDNKGMSGDYFFLNFMDSAFKRYNLQSKVDVRVDLEHGNQGAIAQLPYEQQQLELARAGAIKTNFNNFFFSLAKAVRDNKISIQRAQEILISMLPFYKDTWMGLAEMTLTEEPLAGGKTRPEGVPMIFKAKPGMPAPMVTEFDFRPSGTDPLKSKVYMDAVEITSEQVKRVESDFTALTRYDLYEVLEHYKIPSIDVKPDLDALGLSLEHLDLTKGISSPVQTVPVQKAFPGFKSNLSDYYITPVESLKALGDIGQKTWLDGVTFEMITSGQFADELVAKHGISGVTTNPNLVNAYFASETVRNKAAELFKQGKIKREVYAAILGELAQLINDAFEQGGQMSGRLSIEIPPVINSGPVAEAVEEGMFWTGINPDHIMVKVALTSDAQGNDTPNGYRIIEDLISRGRMVNATLIFTPDHYQKVVDAYIRGLVRALANVRAGKLTAHEFNRIYSVASFFVSRWDVNLEEYKRISDRLRGKAANAITIAAYNENFKTSFSDNNRRWQILKADVAEYNRTHSEKLVLKVQDFLLASTGSKAGDLVEKKKIITAEQGLNYPAGIYVYDAQGANVVNTLPIGTINSMIKNGVATDSKGRVARTIEAGYSRAKQAELELVNHLSGGATIRSIGAELLAAANKSFGDEYNKTMVLLDDLEAKAKSSSPINQKASSAIANRQEAEQWLRAKFPKMNQIFIKELIDDIWDCQIPKSLYLAKEKLAIAGVQGSDQQDEIVNQVFIILLSNKRENLEIWVSSHLENSSNMSVADAIAKEIVQVAFDSPDDLWSIKRAISKSRSGAYLAQLGGERIQSAVKGLLAASSPINSEKLGGIDFRKMNIIARPMGTLAGLSFSLPKPSQVSSVNIDVEFDQIRSMVKANILPSDERLKEFVAACYHQNELSGRRGEITACLTDICRIQEEKGLEASKGLKEVIILADTI